MDSIEKQCLECVHTPQVNLWCNTSTPNPSCEAAPPNPLKRSLLTSCLTYLPRKINFFLLFRERKFAEENLFYTVSAPEPWSTEHTRPEWLLITHQVEPLRACFVCFPMANRVLKICTRHIYSLRMYSVSSPAPSISHFISFRWLPMALMIYFTWASWVVPKFFLRDSDFC